MNSVNVLSMRSLLSCIMILACFVSDAQIGGSGVYSFLNLQASPRYAALGGAPVSISDSDPNVGFYLPSRLNASMDRHLAMNYVNYFSDINVGMVNYVKHYDSVGTFSMGMLYSNYGKFTAYDEKGNEQGEFRAADYAAQIGYGIQRGRWGYGANAKLIYSQLETYKSLGAALDLSASYTSDSGLFSTSLLMRNIGTQFMSYYQTREKLPFEIQWSFSKKLKHAPLRLIAVVHNMETWKLGYINTNERNKNLSFDNQQKDQKVTFADNAFRHVILATELVFSPNFMLRVGYNHQRRKEMTWTDVKGIAGFSWGVGIKISRLRFDYSLASFFPGKSSHQFSLTLNLNEFGKK
ncbi:MAG: type IX secretion system protein PorQ [Bacteroidetes bacterium]|nr:type IX secretion system protein PorQ [Bacteroidota bacterium]